MDNKLFRPGFAVGMIHLPPIRDCLRGGYSEIQRLTQIACQDAHVLEVSGFDGIMVQNGKDISPKSESDTFTVALLSAVCNEIRQTVKIPLGISVLKNDVRTALAIAKTSHLQFVRCKVYAGAVVAPEGIVEGCAHEALEYRRALCCEEVELWSETYDLSSRPLLEQSFEEDLKWCKKMGSDTFLVCGRSHDQTLDYCRRARKITDNQKIVIGGGVNLNNLEESLAVCDGFVVGSAVEEVPFTGPVSEKKAEAFIAALRRCRSQAGYTD